MAALDSLDTAGASPDSAAASDASFAGAVEVKSAVVESPDATSLALLGAVEPAFPASGEPSAAEPFAPVATAVLSAAPSAAPVPSLGVTA